MSFSFDDDEYFIDGEVASELAQDYAVQHNNEQYRQSITHLTYPYGIDKPAGNTRNTIDKNSNPTLRHLPARMESCKAWMKRWRGWAERWETH